MFRLVSRAIVIIGLLQMLLVGSMYLLAPHLPTDGQLVYVVSLFTRLQLVTSDMSHGLTLRLHASDSNDIQPTVSTMTGDIVFVSDRYGDAELFWLSANGLHLRRLTDNDDDDLYPQWSPDGTQLVYQSNPEGLSQFFLMSLDSQTIQPLTDSPHAIARPVWSPDGERIAYDSEGEIYIYEVVSGDTTRLTDDGFWDQLPSWSPDSKMIVYESNRRSDWRLYGIDITTQETFSISQPDRNDQHVTWMDDRRILFQSTRQFPGRLYTVHLDNPAQIDEVFIPPLATHSLYLLFGDRERVRHEWTDVIEPVWVR